MSEENRATMRRMADKQVDIDLAGKLQVLAKRGIDLYESVFTVNSLEKIRKIGWHNNPLLDKNMMLDEDYSWFMALQYAYSTGKFRLRNPKKCRLTYSLKHLRYIASSV